MKRNLRTEFINMMDDSREFRQLSQEDIGRIIDIELEKVKKRLIEKDLTLIVTDEAKDYIAKEGYSPEFGARPLRRSIEHLIEDPMAEELLRGAYQNKDTI